MQLIGELRHQKLTPELVLHLHRVVTAAGDRIAHRPPPATELPQRLKTMCDFANGTHTRGFIHPVVRAIVMHFWLAYDHPFEDGNGRTARALFSWSMLSQGYWLAEFVTISSILRKAPSKYSRAFLYTETDQNDLTYFLIYQLEVLGRAIKELHAYLGRKMAGVRNAEALLKQSSELSLVKKGLLKKQKRGKAFSFTPSPELIDRLSMTS